MSWAVGWDDHRQRDVGYGVPAYCDHPRCHAEIDRGLSYVCGGQPNGGGRGCGLYFCVAHLGFYTKTKTQACPRCGRYKAPYKHPKPDHPVWVRHKLTDPTWAEWRDTYPAEAEKLKALAVDGGKD